MADRVLRTVYEVIDKATDKLEAIEKSTSSLSIVSAAAFLDIAERATRAVKAFAQFAISGIEAADAMGDMAKRIGVTTETLSTLELGARMSGASLQDVEIGLRTLARRAVDANEGLAEARKSFDGLGIDVRAADGSLRSVDDLLPEIADAFREMGDSTERTALAQELFGRSGANLIPLLSQGRQGLSALREEADRLGITLTSSAAAAADKASDNMAKLKLQVSALTRDMGLALVPAVELVTQSVSGLTVKVREFFDGIVQTQEAQKASIRIQDLSQSSGASLLETYAGLLSSVRNVKGGTEAFNKEMDIARQRLASGKDQLAAMIVGLENVREKTQAAAQAQREQAEAQEGLSVNLPGLTQALTEFADINLSNIAAERQARLEAFDQFVKQNEGLTITSQQASDARLQIIKAGLDRERELQAAELSRMSEEQRVSRISDVSRRHQEELALLNQKLALEGASNFEAAKARTALAGKQASEIVAIRQREGQQIVELGTKLGDVLSASEAQRGNAFKAFLKDYIRGKVKELSVAAVTEIAKAQVAAPLTLGASLLLIPVIAAAQAAAEGVLNQFAFQRGGPIPGYGGGDTVPILAERGEFVVNKEATAMFRPHLVAMNEAGRFQAGGEVTAPVGGGVTVNIGTIENISDTGYIDLLVEAITRRVRFGGARLVASEVLS